MLYNACCTKSEEGVGDVTSEASAAEVFVYLDRMAAAPGESVGVHVGTIGGSSEPVTIELCHADWQDVNGKVATVLEPVTAADVLTAQTDTAPIRSGSFLFSNGYQLPQHGGSADAIAIGLLVHLRAAKPGLQRLMQWTVAGVELAVSVQAQDVIAELTGPNGQSTRVAVAPGRLIGKWWAIAAAVGDDNTIEISAYDLRDRTELRKSALSTQAPGVLSILSAGPGTVMVAAAGNPSAPTAFLTAKVESPLIAAESASDATARLSGPASSGQVLSRWDFASDMTSATVPDTGLAGRPATLVNAPMRAVTGSCWDGTVLDWRVKPSQYGAIYFHDTDLDDAGWNQAAELVIPADTAAGLYAIRCRAASGEDHVPLIVRPDAPSADVMMLMSTFTYLAYANSSLFKNQHFDDGVVVGRSARDDQLSRHPMLGLSVYDTHWDGSGVATSSHLRPILNMRFDHRSSIQDAPRNLGADLFISCWLQRVAPGHTYLTDHDLHFAGAVPSGTRVLVTGTHPEYFSTQMLDALEKFQRAGGSIMYLGGNGFYWVTTCDAQSPHRIEVRRGHAGIRSWESEPGENHHATTGQPGGLWRHLGRPPNRLVGVGMAAQGWDSRAPGYVRAAEAVGQIADRILNGIEPDQPVGDFGFAMGGAAGDEIDRMDLALGTPPDTLRLLTSQRHSHLYKIAIEDINMVSDLVSGATTDRVRSDVCLMPTGYGGHVFSVGSMTWASSLAWNDFGNNVETVTRNALRFLLDDSR